MCSLVASSICERSNSRILVSVRLRMMVCHSVNRFLGEGRGIANGFHQALCLTCCGPTLILNLAFASFYLPLNFVEFACKCIGKDITRFKTADELEGIKSVLRNLLGTLY